MNVGPVPSIDPPEPLLPGGYHWDMIGFVAIVYLISLYIALRRE